MYTYVEMATLAGAVWGWKLWEFSLVFWLPQITAFVSVTNIAVTGGDNSKESSVHFFFKLCLSLPIYCHNFTHRAALEPGHCSEIVRVTKTSDNQSPDHQPMRARACCLHSLSVLFPLSSWAGALTISMRLWAPLRDSLLFVGSDMSSRCHNIHLNVWQKVYFEIVEKCIMKSY